MLLAECFSHCPKCGSAALQSRKAKSFDCPDCGFHFYLNPAVAAAALIVSNRRPGEVLFVRRAKDPGKGRLGLIGGFVDSGETIEQAVEREVKEELGLKVAEATYFASFPNEYPFRGVSYPVADVFFLVRVLTEDFRLQREEVTEATWLAVPEMDLNDLAFPSMRKAVALYRDKLAEVE
ncbi:MAG TPA: NUDIX domain-containing protein [Chthoniobacterales bacterium]